MCGRLNFLCAKFGLAQLINQYFSLYTVLKAMASSTTHSNQNLISFKTAEASLVDYWFNREDSNKRCWIAPETTLIHYNQLVDALWFIQEGTAQVRMAYGTVVRVKAPTLFGEMAFLTGSNATAEVTALTEILVIKYTFDDLRIWLGLDPTRTVWLYENLTKIAAHRLLGEYHRRYCALVAHDGRKAELISFIAEHRAFFSEQNLLATATTGERIESELGLQIARTVLSGPKGGDPRNRRADCPWGCRRCFLLP